jgi:hypothetical protein
MPSKSLISMIKTASKKEDDEEKTIAEEFKNDYIYTADRIDDSHPASKTLSPSNMNCSRAMSCKLLAIPKDEAKGSYTMSAICCIGSALHQMIQQNCLQLRQYEYLNVADYVRENKLPLEIGKESNFETGEMETHLYKLDKNGERYISFLCDGLIKSKKTGKVYILEIKSVGASGFFSQKDILDKHRVQATAYSILLNIPTVLMMYTSRDIPNIKIFSFTPSKEEKDVLKHKCDLVISKAKENIIVAKPDIDKKLCAYCDWRKFCNKIGEGEFKYG